MKTLVQLILISFILSFSNSYFGQSNILVYSGMDFGIIKLNETVDFNHYNGVYYDQELNNYSYTQTKIGLAWERTSIGWSSIIIGLEYGKGIKKEHIREAQDITTGSLFDFNTIEKTNSFRLNFSMGFAVIGDLDDNGFQLVANLTLIQEVNLFTYFSNNPPSNHYAISTLYNTISTESKFDVVSVTYLAPGLMANYVLNENFSIFATTSYRFDILNGSSELEYGQGLINNLGVKFLF